MTEFRTKSGRVLTDEDIQALADEAEAGLDVSKLKRREPVRRRTWVIGFFVRVEVDATDANDAIHIANAAANWPGDWQPPMDPVTVTGDLNGHDVSAIITRSTSLLAYPKENT